MFVDVHVGAVQAQADALAQLAGRLEPGAVPLPEAPGLWEAFDRIERLAGGAKLLLARRVDESGVWQQAGDRDAGAWMARHGGTSVTAARIELAASKRLAALPAVTDAVRRGELSVAQAEPVADAASRMTDEEARLLRLAKEASLGELREECGRVKFRADPDPERRQRRIRADRRLRQGKTSDGAWWLSGRGPVEDAAELDAVLGPIVDEIFREVHSEGRAEPRESYAWDALVELARRAHDWVYNGTGDDGVSATDDESTRGQAAGDDEPTPREADGDDERNRSDGDGSFDMAGTQSEAGQRKVRRPRRGRRRRMNEKYLGLLRVDLEALARGETGDGEICEIGGVPVPVSVARQVLGESVLKLVLTRGEQVVTTVHLGRGPGAAQKVALRWLSPTCSVLGCNRTDLEFDHRIDWAETRHTVLWELDGICGHHHHLKTHDGWALVPGTGKRAMVKPDDPRHPRHRCAGDIRAGPDGTCRAAGDSSCLSEPESRSVAA